MGLLVEVHRRTGLRVSRSGDALRVQRLLPHGHHIPVFVVRITQVDVEGTTSFEPNVQRKGLAEGKSL
jgi:hypothetical protein